MAMYPLLPGTPLYETRAEPGYRFRVEKPIGQGGFGVTYLATDLEFQGPCVIKEFALNDLCARADATGTVTVAPGREPDFARWLERFEREARQIHSIRHAGVVRVRAVWRERGTAYYAMDLVEGARELPSPDEADWAPMPWAAAELIARGMLSALEAVHRRGLIHGDIKPSNVLLDSDDRPVLIDFGTARTSDDLQRTVTSAMYTPGYAPPELTTRSQVRDAGPWSDLYSWAMVVWGLVARHPGIEGRPMDAASRQLIAESGGTDRYVGGAGTLRAAGVPIAWARVIAECLAVAPDARPQSVAAVELILSGSSTATTGTGGSKTGHEPSPRQPLPPSEVVDAAAPASGEVTAALQSSEFRFDGNEAMKVWLQRAAERVSGAELWSESMRIGHPPLVTIPFAAPLYTISSISRLAIFLPIAMLLVLLWGLSGFLPSVAPCAAFVAVCGVIAFGSWQRSFASLSLDRSNRRLRRLQWAALPLVLWTSAVIAVGAVSCDAALMEESYVRFGAILDFVRVLLIATVFLVLFAVGLPVSIRRSIEREWVAAISAVYKEHGAQDVFDQRMRLQGFSWLVELCPWVPVNAASAAAARPRSGRGWPRL